MPILTGDFAPENSIGCPQGPSVGPGGACARDCLPVLGKRCLGALRPRVCDDPRVLLEALSMALTDNGHTVVATAIDPDEAVEAARKHQPDACLLDVNFPHANGLAANGLAAIRRIHEVSPNTKVVILSGSISGSLVPDAVAEGAQGFVGKEKPVGVIIEALEMARQGHLAVDLHLLQEALGPPSATV